LISEQPQKTVCLIVTLHHGLSLLNTTISGWFFPPTPVEILGNNNIT
jgi:hypothetical protein